jgi:YNFM family putative membrane transporter
MKEKQNDTSFDSWSGLQLLVFSLVAAAFTTIYITQPVLPIFRSEFGVDETYASLTISAVIFGIAVSNCPLGIAADRFPIKPIILTGGIVITLCGLACSMTASISVLIGTRFVQGLFIPCLTTCVAAFLSKTLPREKLNVVMGSYISATVAGGLGGRLLGGFIHPPLHWRYAFVTASVMVFLATLAAYRFLPQEKPKNPADAEDQGFLVLIVRPELLRTFLVAFSAFFVFSSVFNYLPFYLSSPEFGASTNAITFMYTSYVIGIIMGPIAGKLSNRMGNGVIMALGAVVFAVSIGTTLIKSMPGIALSLCGICAGFFAVHAAAAGSLNRRLESSRGRANSLYVLFYYLGGFAGISVSGYMYVLSGWPGIVVTGWLVLIIPFATGIWELRHKKRQREPQKIGKVSPRK